LSRAADEARHEFDQVYLSRFKSRKYAPKEILYLKGMSSSAVSSLGTLQEISLARYAQRRCTMSRDF
jgi:hypothetical protein